MRPVLSINDGVIGCAGDHAFCIPVNFKHIIVSNDMVCNDRHASDFENYPYERSPHQKLNIDLREGDPNCPLIKDANDEPDDSIWEKYSLPPSTLEFGDAMWSRLVPIMHIVPLSMVNFSARKYIQPAFAFLGSVIPLLTTMYTTFDEKEVKKWDSLFK
jgi:hypothetical protein